MFWFKRKEYGGLSTLTGVEFNKSESSECDKCLKELEIKEEERLAKEKDKSIKDIRKKFKKWTLVYIKNKEDSSIIRWHIVQQLWIEERLSHNPFCSKLYIHNMEVVIKTLGGEFCSEYISDLIIGK